jgi:hypothetical protein
MPYVDVYRVRKSFFGKSILQQYFNGENLSRPHSGWVDVSFENAPAALHKSKLLNREEASLCNLNLQPQINVIEDAQ